jgi:hypothetical protein
MMTASQIQERESLLQIYSDFHKDAYGFRPRHINYYAFSLEQLKADFKHFREVCDENKREEEIAAAAALVKFKAKIQGLIDMGAGNEETALRWLIDAEEFIYDAEHYVWQQGIFSTDYGRELAVKIQPIVTERWIAERGE